MHIFCILQPPEDREISASAARKPAAFEEILRLDREKIGQYSARTAEKIEKNNKFLQNAEEITKMQRTLEHGPHKAPGKFFLFAKKLAEAISFHKI